MRAGRPSIDASFAGRSGIIMRGFFLGARTYFVARFLRLWFGERRRLSAGLVFYSVQWGNHRAQGGNKLAQLCRNERWQFFANSRARCAGSCWATHVGLRAVRMCLWAVWRPWSGGQRSPPAPWVAHAFGHDQADLSRSLNCSTSQMHRLILTLFCPALSPVPVC